MSLLRKSQKSLGREPYKTRACCSHMDWIFLVIDCGRMQRHLCSPAGWIMVWKWPWRAGRCPNLSPAGTMGKTSIRSQQVSRERLGLVSKRTTELEGKECVSVTLATQCVTLKFQRLKKQFFFFPHGPGCWLDSGRRFSLGFLVLLLWLGLELSQSLLQSHVWWLMLTVSGDLGLLAGRSKCSLSVWPGLPRSMVAGFREQTSQEDHEEGVSPPKVQRATSATVTDPLGLKGTQTSPWPEQGQHCSEEHVAWGNLVAAILENAICCGG